MAEENTFLSHGCDKPKEIIFVYASNTCPPGNEDLQSPVIHCAKCYCLFQVFRMKWTPEQDICPACMKKK